MKALLSTTALTLALSLPALTSAQTTQSTTAPETAAPEAQNQSGDMSGFLSGPQQSDVFASELMGKDVYARSAEADADASAGGSDMTTMNSGDLEGMDNIGQINEVILSSDGQVRALVIGVGGFLGVGEQDVAVTMEQVSFASDADDAEEFYVVVNTNAEMLQNSPSFDRTAMESDAEMDSSGGSTTESTDTQATETETTDTESTDSDSTETEVIQSEPTDTQAADTETETTDTDSTTMTDSTQQSGDTSTAPAGNAEQTERTAFTGPEIEREEYSRMEMQQVTTEVLVGRTVYGVNDESIGEIDDMVLDSSGQVSDVIIDFGGFLGLGSSQVALGFDEVTIVSNEDQSDVRVYVDATQEQIESMPEYEPAD